VHGAFCQYPGGQVEHFLQSLSTVSIETFLLHMLMSTKFWVVPFTDGHCSSEMLVQFRQSVVSVRVLPSQVLFMYVPLGQYTLQSLQIVSSSIVHGDEMYLLKPHVSLQEEHAAYESMAQSLLTKLCPSTHWLGQVVQLMVFAMPLPVQGVPFASRLGGQSFWDVHSAHPLSYV
jgi:hypothetical protein